MLISFLLNCAIVLMAAFSFIAMFIGWDFMGKKGQLEAPGVEMFKYFTIDSNVLMGVCSLIVLCAQIPVLLGKATALAPLFYGIKLMGTSAVMLTLLVTVGFLTPKSHHPEKLYYNSNFFFHLVIPITAAISFMCTEHADTLPATAALVGIVPTAVYEIYYIWNVMTHLKDGEVDRDYDFYNFLGGNKNLAAIAAIIILVISFGISLLLWWGNRHGFAM